MFFDSSVRSTRTIVLRSPVSARSAASLSFTSGRCASARSSSPSTPSGYTATVVRRCRTGPLVIFSMYGASLGSTPAAVFGSAMPRSSSSCAAVMKLCAHAHVWKPTTSAPSMPHISCARTSSGSMSRNSREAHGVCVKWLIFRSGRSSRSSPGTSARW